MSDHTDPEFMVRRIGWFRDADPGDLVDVFDATIDDLRAVQACADAAGRTVRWHLSRIGTAGYPHVCEVVS